MIVTIVFNFKENQLFNVMYFRVVTKNSNKQLNLTNRNKLRKIEK